MYLLVRWQASKDKSLNKLWFNSAHKSHGTLVTLAGWFNGKTSLS